MKAASGRMALALCFSVSKEFIWFQFFFKSPSIMGMAALGVQLRLTLLGSSGRLDLSM
jgi:hypothetical protein